MPAKTSINLIGDKEFDKSLVGRFLRWALSYGRYIIISTEIIVLLSFIFRFSLDRKITDLNEEVTNKAKIVEINQPFEKKFRNIQSRMNNIAALTTNQNSYVDAIKHLEQITPKGISFSTLTILKNNLTIEAKANSALELGAFIQQLRSSEYFEQITVNTLTKQEVTSGDIRFNLNAALKTQTE